MKVKVKKLYPDAQLPTYATDGSAAFDIYAYMPEEKSCRIKPGFYGTFETGLSFEIPEGHVLLIYSRSGHGFNSNVRLSNAVGVLDADYRGSLRVKLINDSNERADYYKHINIYHGDRIAQGIIMPYPKVEFEEVDELSETQRGTGGFGSTGK